MRGFAIVASLALALGVAPVVAQQTAAGQGPAGSKPPAAPAPAPKPAGQAPAAAAPAPAPTLPPPAPFPQGAKHAFVNLQVVAQLSVDGKAAATKVSALTQKKQGDIAERTKTLQANQQKLQSSGGVMSDSARGQLEKDIERQQRELERAQQDAQAELNDLQQELQGEFQKKLLPVLEALAKEKGLHFLFSGADAGLIWAEPGLDLTQEAVKKLDGK